MEKIIIEGNKVKFVEEVIKRQIDADQFIAHIEDTVGVNTGILPRNCLYMKRENGISVYVVEVPAGCFPVKYRSDKLFDMVLSFPFTQFYIPMTASGSIGNIYLTVTKIPVKSVKDTIYTAPYLNIFNKGRGKLCTGNVRVPDTTNNIEKINGVINGFYMAESNLDLNPAIPACFSNQAKLHYKYYYHEWEEFTKKDKFFAVSDTVQYTPRNKSIEDMIDICLGKQTE